MGNQLALDLRESLHKLVCDYCGAALVPRGFTTGGGVNAAGETLCNSCCAFADVIDMVNTEPGQTAPIALYVVPDELLTVANWPSTLKLQILRYGAWVPGGFGSSKRRTIYFRGPMGSRWSGVEYNGNAGNLLRKLRRLKA